MFIGFSSTFIGIYSDQKLLFIRQHHRNFEGSRILNFEKICSDPRSEDIFIFFKSSSLSLVPIILQYYGPSLSYQRFCPKYFLDFCSKMGESTYKRVYTYFPPILKKKLKSTQDKNADNSMTVYNIAI